METRGEIGGERRKRMELGSREKGNIEEERERE